MSENLGKPLIEVFGQPRVNPKTRRPKEEEAPPRAGGRQVELAPEEPGT